MKPRVSPRSARAGRTRAIATSPNQHRNGPMPGLRCSVIPARASGGSVNSA
mgnify:CR=1 FL=1